MHLSVALGVMAATAVLTGALIVGASVRGSLRVLTLERLGRIDHVLVAQHFFRAELASEVASESAFAADFDRALPALIFPNATVEHKVAGAVQRAGNVLLVAVDESFWDWGDDVRPQQTPGDDQIVLNRQLADQFAAAAGSEVTVRLPKDLDVPGDSALGRKSDTVQGLPGLEVVDVVPNRGLGRFTLHPNQSLPKVAFVSLAYLQDALDQDSRANALLVSTKTTAASSEAAGLALQERLAPRIEDLGFRLDRIRQTSGAGESEQVAFDYFSFTSEAMLITHEAEQVAKAAFARLGGQPVMTYFVNTISPAGVIDPTRQIPYSMVSGIDTSANFPLLGEEVLPMGECVLTDWAAREMNVKPGDSISITYFEPETTHGKTETAEADFIVRGVYPLIEPAEPYDNEKPPVYDQPRRLLNDPDFTPRVEGITDKDSINNLDVPFPFDIGRLRQPDHDFWKAHRTTPKVIVSAADARQLWGSRFGNATSYRIPVRDGVTREALAAAFLDERDRQGLDLGLQFLPIKRQQLQASSGTTPFDVLFLSLSFFIIFAALALVYLLFRLGVEQRCEEIGLLLAIGWRRRSVTRLFALEGSIVAAGGAVLGVVAGIAYAQAMLYGLTTVWVGAVVTPFLEMHLGPVSMIGGFVGGVVVSVATIWFGVRQTRKVSVRRLLAGRTEDSVGRRAGGTLGWRIAAAALLLGAVGLLVLATQLGGMAQAGSFVGGGTMTLFSILFVLGSQMRAGLPATNRLTMFRLSTRNAARNPWRSTLTIFLMGVASFLIISMSAFRLDPTEEGSGGFNMVATSSQPVYADLNNLDERGELLAQDADVLTGSTVLSLRFKPGDDASCRNLYQASAPRVLGVTDAMLEYFDRDQPVAFQFAGSAAETPAQQANPWRLLEKPVAPGAAIPVILDKNTAMYSLHLYRGVGEEFEAEYDGFGTLKFRVAGLLDNSVLQGSLLIGEAEFETQFQNVDGYRYFLLRTPADKSTAVSALLEDRLGDQGFDTESSAEILTDLLAVQNTYLSTFQSLGALGLLLGTFGLAAVQLRNVMERRGELAVLQAGGFRRGRLVQMVLLENVLLLAGGLATGVIAAAIAVLPHMIFGGAKPPFAYLAGVPVVVFAVGILASLTSVRATLQAPLLAALRGD
jgi:ABC-type antimicrobial peptide transport system permease subunit